jgi:hypothetical protein
MAAAAASTSGFATARTWCCNKIRNRAHRPAPNHLNLRRRYRLASDPRRYPCSLQLLMTTLLRTRELLDVVAFVGDENVAIAVDGDADGGIELPFRVP